MPPKLHDVSNVLFMHIRLDVFVRPDGYFSVLVYVTARERPHRRILAPDGNADSVLSDKEQTPIVVDRYLANTEVAMDRLAIIYDKRLQRIVK